MIAHCFYAAMAVADILLESSMFELFSKLDILITHAVVVVIVVVGRQMADVYDYCFFYSVFCSA